MNWILWLRIHECSKDHSNALYTVMKNGSPEMAHRVAAPRKQLLAPDPPCLFFFVLFFSWMVASYVRICLTWLPGVGQGAASVWRLPENSSRWWSTAPEAAATKWPIFFCCYEGFPMFLRDGRVVGTYYRGLWLYLANKFTISMTL